MTIRRHVNIFSLIALSLALLASCAKPPQPGQAPVQETESTWDDPRGFDPLELPRDKEITPARYPQNETLEGKQTLVEVDSGELSDDSTAVAGPEPQVDSLNNQVFRVQLMSSRVYSEARNGARVAEEIFDQPVYVDYEVPNYKVRVGNFAQRPDAVDYQQKARAAGYSNAWVTVVTLKIREAGPLYEDLPGLPQGETRDLPDSAAVEEDGD